ncbi:DUF262 domain-containing protein [Hymenobacter aerophilus]|uniref:DUF262 domain-containing protein n=1 Tax=Hymenobacter aerophilus TaxID=119644 RepID=UPI00035C31C1|nr:DUF262 domain-containing protein [Hymenobacter aerophilus]
MIPSKLTVGQIFEQERRLVVPLFQRPYVWGELDQWQPLWLDIQQLAEEELARMSRGSAAARKKLPNHFIGAVVLAKMDTWGRAVPARNVIDGQQRMTTLQIVLTALHDVAAAQEVEGIDRVFERLTRNNYRSDFAYEQFKVWPTSGDQKVFEQVLTAGSPQEVNRLFPLTKGFRKRNYDRRPQLVEAYLYFTGVFEAFLLAEDLEATDEGPSQDLISARVDALLECITKRLEVVMVELEDEDDPQVIFESLNGRGVQLRPSDLIRNLVFLEANKQQRNLEELHKQYWAEFDDSGQRGKFWQQETRQGRLKRSRLDLFFFHFLTLQRQEQLPITQLYTEFRSWWLEAASDNAETELANLRQYGDVYRGFFERGSRSRLSTLMHRLQVMDTSVFYPVLLGLYTRWESKTDARQLDGILTDLESYLVRRMVCQLTPKNYNNIALDLLQVLEEAPTITRATVADFLGGLSSETTRWPADEEFKASCSTKPLYECLSKPRLQMLLHALDLQLETSRQEQVHLQSDLTIEHVYPQQPEAGTWDYIDEEERKEVLHQLGNLTLLTGSLNSSVSNGPFSRKRKKIAEQSRIRLNVYFQGFEDDYLWDASDIRQRGKELAKLALQIWPRPA